MVVGFDGSRAFVKSKTGTENYSYQLLLHLSRMDRQNRYIVYFRPGNIVEGEWPDNFEFKPINFKRLWTQVGLSIQTFKDPLDLLFTPAHTIPILRKPGLKTVMTVHDLGAEYLPAMHQLKQRLYLGFITRFQLKNTTKLIAVSNATKRDLVCKAGVDPKNIEVIYEGYDQNMLKGDELKEVLIRYDLEKDKYFLFVGTVQPRKNLSRLIEAFAILGNGYKLVIAGMRGWMSEDIYALPKKLGIGTQVKFIGRVSDSELSSLYKGALGLTYPSLYEGFGLPILEAFANDCPVMTSNRSSMPEVAGKAAILVDPFDIDSIKNGLEKLLDAKLRQKQVQLGRQRVKLFSWEEAARETLELFKKI